MWSHILPCTNIMMKNLCLGRLRHAYHTRRVVPDPTVAQRAGPQIRAHVQTSRSPVRRPPSRSVAAPLFALNLGGEIFPWGHPAVVIPFCLTPLLVALFYYADTQYALTLPQWYRRGSSKISMWRLRSER
ncbi:hypothetical protein B0H67DRAFT_236689 [Lasiosphaeris hirsuta]|uniref:Uncharacterized protein n=1 Tax=Lasiosphaeris hirsuta TaxID=260670 RepID=A0AA40AG57_9PEZI|nr:hypothetical protein B0H67DRAFT_236689 [Lasiosphaeris hirsuta]